MMQVLEQRRKKMNLRQKKLLNMKKLDLQNINADFKKRKSKCQIKAI